MSLAAQSNPEKPGIDQDTRSQATQELTKPMTFDDLVIDGALDPVEIKLSPTRTREQAFPTDELLIELQCEV
jgi:hypothetical protein